MIDDIVTRLRKRCDSANCWRPMGDERCLDMEAADEIAKLRYQIRNYRSALCGIEYDITEERRKLEEAADDWWEYVDDGKPPL
jgi:hypothetical protein